MSHDDRGPSAALSKRGRISGSSNSTLLDWGAQSGECWSARPGWEWWLPRHGCPKPLKCSTSPQEALWHSSLHFLNQSWVIRAATGKRTDQTIIPPHPPFYPFDMWQSSKRAAPNIHHFYQCFWGEKKHWGSILWSVSFKFVKCFELFLLIFWDFKETACTHILWSERSAKKKREKRIYIFTKKVCEV